MPKLYYRGYGIRGGAGCTIKAHRYRATRHVKEKRRQGVSKQSIVEKCEVELAPLLNDLKRAFEGKAMETADVQALWMSQFERNRARWFHCVSVLLKLGAIADDDMNGWADDRGLRAEDCLFALSMGCPLPAPAPDVPARPPSAPATVANTQDVLNECFAEYDTPEAMDELIQRMKRGE